MKLRVATRKIHLLNNGQQARRKDRGLNFGARLPSGLVVLEEDPRDTSKEKQNLLFRMLLNFNCITIWFLTLISSAECGTLILSKGFTSATPRNVHLTLDDVQKRGTAALACLITLAASYTWAVGKQR